MFLPLHDETPMRNLRAPFVTYALLGFTVLAFLATGAGLIPGVATDSIARLGLFPAVLWGNAVLPPGYDQVPPLATLFTSAFLHVGWFHLASNMLFLWVFGDNVEDALGHAGFLIFYLVCAAAAAIAHAAAFPMSDSPMIGASGAVAGVVGAYLVLYPRVRLFGLIFNIIPVTLTASWVLGAWVLTQIYHAVMGDQPGVAWWGHIGGALAGALMILPVKLGLVKLTQQRLG